MMRIHPHQPRLNFRRHPRSPPHISHPDPSPKLILARIQQPHLLALSTTKLGKHHGGTEDFLPELILCMYVRYEGRREEVPFGAGEEVECGGRDEALVTSKYVGVGGEERDDLFGSGE